MYFCHGFKKRIKRLGCLVSPFLITIVVMSNGFLFKLNAQKTPAQSAVTYRFKGKGRFGDQIFAYIKAHLISYVHDIPLFYKPFIYSNQLNMHVEETHHHEALEEKFQQVIDIDCTPRMQQIERDKPILYVVTAFSRIEPFIKGLPLSCELYLQDLKHKISPLPHVLLEKIYRPSDQISVAVHVRRGGGFDLVSSDPQSQLTSKKNFYADLKWPTKFPPQKFYISKIRELSAMFPGQPLYIHIFTDDQNPALLVQEFQTALKDLPLTFATRYQNNFHDQNVLDDLWGMSQFDCLIRPFSHFSMVAEILGKFRVVLAAKPSRFYKNQRMLNQLLIHDNQVRELQGVGAR